MGAFTRLKIIITEGATENVLQSLLKPYREGDAAARSLCSPAVLGPIWKSCRARGALPPSPLRAGQRPITAGPAVRPENEPGGTLLCPGLIGLFVRGRLGLWFFNGCKPPSRNIAHRHSLGLLFCKTKRSHNEPRRQGTSSACPAGEPRARPWSRCVQMQEGRTGGPSRLLPLAHHRSHLSCSPLEESCPP